MGDMKKKLDALRALHGLTTGDKLSRPGKPPEAADHAPASTPDRTARAGHTESVGPTRSDSVEASPKVARLADLLQESGLKTGATWRRERATQPVTQRRSTSPPRESAHGVNRLRGLTDRLGVPVDHDFGTEYRYGPQITQEERDAGTYTIENRIPGQILGDAGHGFYLVRHDYRLDFRQGIVKLGAVLETQARHIAFSACDPQLSDFDPRNACFVDTETTGLMGGAGTVAFLVGVGYFTGDVFRLDQCLMRDFDDEEPMLHYLAELFDRHEALVSYNGKSFDLPLLRTRFIQNRIPFRSESILHLDLVHAARRFWKQRLRDCSLGNIEREILAIHREGDVPGYMIPELWFRYLDERDARPLERVLYHHEMDILSLVSLTAWMSQCLDAPAGQGFAHVEDKLSIVRLHYRQKNYDEVIEHAAAFLREVSDTPLRRECLEMLGLAFKRRERWEDMQAAWEQLLDAFPADPVASHELAKHLEHRARDLAAAAHLCRDVLTHYATRDGSAGLDCPEARAFRHRLARLEKKLGRHRDQEEF